MSKLVKRFWNDEQGLELSEYAVMVGLIIIIAVLTIITVGNHINGIFGRLGNHLSNANK